MPEEPKIEEKTAGTPNPSEPNAYDSAKIILDLKKQVEDLTKANKDLNKAQNDFYEKILNGGEGQEPRPTKHRPIADIKKDLINTFSDDKETSNLSYCKLVLELDDAVREDTGESVFVPKGPKATPTVDEYATADRFHDCLKEAFDACNDDPISFNAELEKRIKKTSPIKPKK